MWFFPLLVPYCLYRQDPILLPSPPLLTPTLTTQERFEFLPRTLYLFTGWVLSGVVHLPYRAFKACAFFTGCAFVCPLPVSCCCLTTSPPRYPHTPLLLPCFPFLPHTPLPFITLYLTYLLFASHHPTFPHTPCPCIPHLPALTGTDGWDRTFAMPSFLQAFYHYLALAAVPATLYHCPLYTPTFYTHYHIYFIHWDTVCPLVPGPWHCLVLHTYVYFIHTHIIYLAFLPYHVTVRTVQTLYPTMYTYCPCLLVYFIPFIGLGLYFALHEFTLPASLALCLGLVSHLGLGWVWFGSITPCAYTPLPSYHHPDRQYLASPYIPRFPFPLVPFPHANTFTLPSPPALPAPTITFTLALTPFILPPPFALVYVFVFVFVFGCLVCWCAGMVCPSPFLPAFAWPFIYLPATTPYPYPIGTGTTTCLLALHVHAHPLPTPPPDPLVLAFPVLTLPFPCLGPTTTYPWFCCIIPTVGLLGPHSPYTTPALAPTYITLFLPFAGSGQWDYRTPCYPTPCSSTTSHPTLPTLLCLVPSLTTSILHIWLPCCPLPTCSAL